jgi:hypothetical protein
MWIPNYKRFLCAMKSMATARTKSWKDTKQPSTTVCASPSWNNPERGTQIPSNFTSNYYLSIYLSICLYISIYGSTALCWALAAFSVSWSFTQSVGLLERGISPSQGHYLHTEQHKHRRNAHRHPCLEWDSNPRSQCSSGRRRFMP